MASRPTMLRVTNIPRDATLESLFSALSCALLPDETDITIDATIVPSCSTEDQHNTALAKYFPRVPKYLEPLSLSCEDIQIETDLGDLTLDKTFYGLTQLYPTAPGERIIADIIAVTGLDGHAYGSWRGKGSLARMWLHDFFAKDLPSCRTMTYGYNTKLRHHSIHTIYDYKLDMLEQIKKARVTSEEKRRPLIFISHSFGGIVTTQALVKAEEALENDDDPDTHAIYQATKGLLFFGTPHHGLPTEDILRMIDDKKHAERADLVRSIGQGSEVLSEELRKFGYFAENYKIYSFYERQKTKSIAITDGNAARSGDYIIPVDTDSAILNLPGVNETPVPVDGDHSTMVKFDSQTNRIYRTVLSYIQQLTTSSNGVAEHDIPPTVSRNDSGRNSSKDLIDAINQQHDESVRGLLSIGVSANARDSKGVTVLHHAARTGNDAIVRILVQNGALIQVRDFQGKSPSDYARAGGYHAMAAKLLVGRV